MKYSFCKFTFLLFSNVLWGHLATLQSEPKQRFGGHLGIFLVIIVQKRCLILYLKSN